MQTQQLISPTRPPCGDHQRIRLRDNDACPDEHGCQRQRIRFLACAFWTMGGLWWSRAGLILSSIIASLRAMWTFLAPHRLQCYARARGRTENVRTYTWEDALHVNWSAEQDVLKESYQKLVKSHRQLKFHQILIIAANYISYLIFISKHLCCI